MNDYPTKNIELYAKDEEIARLKSEVEMMTVQAIKFRDMALSHRALLARAANALDVMTQFLLISDVPLEWEENKRRENRELIAELRKAATE